MWIDDLRSEEFVRRPKVFVTGTALSGCTTLVRELGKRAQPPFSIDGAALERAGGVRCEFRGAALVIRSNWRTPMVYDVLDHAETDPHVRHERDFIALTDIVLFVVDSQAERLEANISRLERLRTTLVHQGRDPSQVGVLFAVNKRDLGNRVAIESATQQLTWPTSVYRETIATTGQGVDALVDALAALALRFPTPA